MVASVSNMNLALSLMPKPSAGSVDFSALFTGTGSAASVFSAGNVQASLQQAEVNESKQLELAGKDPVVQRELERFEKVLKNADSLDEVLDDPVARKVLLKAHGLGDQVDNIGLAKKALASDPADPNSLANKLSQVNANWLAFAKKYNVAQNGLEHLYPKQGTFEGTWNVNVERDGEPYVARLELSQTGTNTWAGYIDGEPAGVTVKNGVITVDLLWSDSEENFHTSHLEGELGEDGISGEQTDDGKVLGSWGATNYYGDVLQEIKDNYIAEVRLDNLDKQMPGLGTALLFKKAATTFDTVTKVLGSGLAREVVTTALNIPKEIAIQSLGAQEKAVTHRLDIADLQNPDYVDRLVQRYLINLNGAASGITV